MKADVKQIGDIVQNRRVLRIPYFQRSYVWEKKEWERFAIDVESTLINKQDYFLGALILKTESSNNSEDSTSGKFLVIDGQQRLTTLFLYMKVLHDFAGQMEDFKHQYFRRGSNATNPIVEHSHDDRDPFAQAMQLEFRRKLANPRSSNIIDAYNYFFDRLSEAKYTTGHLNDLIDAIYKYIKFVVIILDEKDDEQRIFDTINSLGVPLTTCDLVKNYLYGPETEQDYYDNWHVVFEHTEEDRNFWDTDASKSRQEKTKDNVTIERFFHAFVRIKMWDFKDSLSEVQRKDYVKMSNVFSTCKDFVEKFEKDKTISEKKQALANEIIEYAKLYRKYLGEDILEDDNIPRYGCIKRISCFINATKQYSVVPYVLYILHEVSNETERNNIFTYLETYLLRRVLIGSKNKSYSEFFAESLIGNRIDTADKLRTFVASKDSDSNLAMPTDQKIKQNANQREALSDQLAQIILYLYETKLSTLTKSYKDFYVQMLMPKSKKGTDNWPVENNNAKEEQRQILMSTIGNYFLLEVEGQKKLKKKADASCADKVDEMRKWYDKDAIGSNHILFDGAANRSLSKWDTEAIKVRNLGFAKFCCENIWKL